MLNNQREGNWNYSKLLDFLFPRTIRTTSKIAKMLGVLPSWIFQGIISMSWAHLGSRAPAAFCSVGARRWKWRLIDPEDCRRMRSAQRSRKGGVRNGVHVCPKYPMVYLQSFGEFHGGGVSFSMHPKDAELFTVVSRSSDFPPSSFSILVGPGATDQCTLRCAEAARRKRKSDRSCAAHFPHSKADAINHPSNPNHPSHRGIPRTELKLGMVYFGVSLVSSEDHKLWRIRSTLHLKRKRHWLRLVGVYGTHWA